MFIPISTILRTPVWPIATTVESLGLGVSIFLCDAAQCFDRWPLHGH